MIKIIGLAFIIYVFYTFVFFYFVEHIFALKHSRVMSYLSFVILNIPCFLVFCLGMYLTYIDFNKDLMIILKILSLFVLFLVRQVSLILFTYANNKQVIVYQLVFYFISLMRYDIEDIFLFIFKQNMIFIQYHFIILTLYRMVMFYVCQYFVNVIYRKLGIEMMRKSDIFLFISCFLVLCILHEKMGKIIYIIASLLFLYGFYYFLWRMNQVLDLDKKIAFEQNYKKDIQKEYNKQQDMMEQLSKIRHDEKNHMLTFQNLYKSDQKKAKEYFYDWHQQIVEKLNDHHI